ncbi:MAG: SAM-dependent methyltransferase [Deltaproteobacteria bacterium]|nr:SAM-dependent methyltransferase [Deltaproteobacteria bacterium]
MGLSAFCLRARGLRFPILGLDCDARKIAIARDAARAHGPDLRFTVHDARDQLPAHDGSVALLDLLQYLDRGEQAALLRAAAERVNADGRLVVRSTLRAPGWRYRLSRAVDWFSAAVRWTLDAAVAYPTADWVQEQLESAGLQGTIRPCWGRTPFNNWLGVFARSGR